MSGEMLTVGNSVHQSGASNLLTLQHNTVMYKIILKNHMVVATPPKKTTPKPPLISRFLTLCSSALTQFEHTFENSDHLMSSPINYFLT